MLTYLQRIEWFIGLVLLQVLVLNHMHINGYATPFFFIYFILKYNSGVSRNVLMIWAFLLGLTVDILGNTPGMNAAAATVLAFMREPVLRLVTLRDSVEDFEPGIKSMGFSPFFRYILLCTFLFCTILLVIDTFSFFNDMQLNFRVSAEELAVIEQKMSQFGTSNREAYLRKMALDGYVVKLELPELKELVSLMRRSSNNLNQLTRKVHETGRVYDADLEDISQRQEQLWEGVKEILTQLSKLL